MAFVSSLFDDGRGLLRVGTGVVTGAEIVNAVKAMIEEPERYGSRVYTVIDFSGADGFSVTDADVEALADIARNYPAVSAPRLIVVVAPARVVRGEPAIMALMQTIEVSPLMMVRSREEAERRLDRFARRGTGGSG